MKSITFAVALLLLCAPIGAMAQFVIERHDGAKSMVDDATLYPGNAAGSYTIGGVRIDDVKSVGHSVLSQDPAGSMVAFPAGDARRVVIFDMNDRNGEIESAADNSRNLYSAQYMMQIAGLPFITTTDLDEALKGSVILLANRVRPSSFTPDEYEQLTMWVSKGGVLIAPAVECDKKASFELFGISKRTTAKNKSFITWIDEPLPEFAYIDEPEEKTVSIGHKFISVTEYELSTGKQLATYGDAGGVAVVKNELGSGCTYTIGVRWRDVICRAQLNKDNAQRIYSNGFEPSADVYPLFVRAVVTAVSPVSVWKYTVPKGYRSVLIPTHDCDSRTAYDEMHYMSDYERSLGLRSHFFLTVHYYRDQGYLSAFYNDETVPLAAKLLEAGHTVGSHSLCHFPDFNKTDRFPMTEISEADYAATATHSMETGITTGGSTWAELVLSKRMLERDLGNHVRSFRSGHLCVNNNMPLAHTIAGYSFSSCYGAADVMSQFPFFTRMDNNWTGDLTNVLQIPLHFSDVFKADKMDENNWREKVPVWFDMINKLKGNYASSVLLIHPNREWKMESEKMLIDMLDREEVGLYNFEEYGDFWLGRLNFDFDYVWIPEEHKVVIKADAEAVKANRDLCLMVECGGELRNATVIDSEGHAMTAMIRPAGEGKYLISL